jgi:hypothetical protein
VVVVIVERVGVGHEADEVWNGFSDDCPDGLCCWKSVVVEAVVAVEHELLSTTGLKLGSMQF